MIKVKRNVWTISPVSVYILIHYHAFQSLAPSPGYEYLKCLAAGELLLLLWWLLLYTGLYPLVAREVRPVVGREAGIWSWW